MDHGNILERREKQRAAHGEQLQDGGLLIQLLLHCGGRGEGRHAGAGLEEDARGVRGMQDGHGRGGLRDGRGTRARSEAVAQAEAGATLGRIKMRSVGHRARW